MDNNLFVGVSASFQLLRLRLFMYCQLVGPFSRFTFRRVFQQQNTIEYFYKKYLLLLSLSTKTVLQTRR